MHLHNNDEDTLDILAGIITVEGADREDLENGMETSDVGRDRHRPGCALVNTFQERKSQIGQFLR